MNPFTRFLRQWLSDSDLQQLLDHWEALEALVIRVYKEGEATVADEAEYQPLRHWMQANYPEWQERLRPYWRQARVGGKPAATDPFLRLIRAPVAADFAGDWEAMQHLPAAREALNQLVLELSNER